MIHDLTNVILESVFVHGKFCMFTDERVDKRCLPSGIYAYQIRHDDESFGHPVEIAERILVNFFGTILTNEKIPVDLDENEIIIMDHNDFIQEPAETGVMDDFFKIKTLEEYINFEKNDTGWDIPLSRIFKKPPKKHRIFISQPFTGKDDKEIERQRKLLYNLYIHYKGWQDQMWNVKLINQHLPNDPFDKEENFRDNKHRDLYRFCRSIGMMKDATDIIIFGDWKHSRGCTLEHEILSRYGLPGTTPLLDQITDASVNVIFNEDLIDFCQNNPEYDDIFEQLFPKEFGEWYKGCCIDTGNEISANYNNNGIC